MHLTSPLGKVKGRNYAIDLHICRFESFKFPLTATDIITLPQATMDKFLKDPMQIFSRSGTKCQFQVKIVGLSRSLNTRKTLSIHLHRQILLSSEKSCLH